MCVGMEYADAVDTVCTCILRLGLYLRGPQAADQIAGPVLKLKLGHKKCRIVLEPIDKLEGPLLCNYEISYKATPPPAVLTVANSLGNIYFQMLPFVANKSLWAESVRLSFAIFIAPNFRLILLRQPVRRARLRRRSD